MYRSRWRPREEDVKGCPQKGQALSFGALEPPVTEALPEPEGLVVFGGLEEPPTEESAADVGVDAWSAMVYVCVGKKTYFMGGQGMSSLLKLSELRGGIKVVGELFVHLLFTSSKQMGISCVY